MGAHVVITLEDFEEFEFQTGSSFFPFMGVLGEIAGVGALLAWFLVGTGRISSKASRGRLKDVNAEDTARSGGDTERVAAGENSDEEQALLGTQSAREDRKSWNTKAEASSGQALLGCDPADDL